MPIGQFIGVVAQVFSATHLDRRSNISITRICRR
jgi:hypothetical protein